MGVSATSTTRGTPGPTSGPDLMKIMDTWKGKLPGAGATAGAAPTDVAGKAATYGDALKIASGIRKDEIGALLQQREVKVKEKMASYRRIYVEQAMPYIVLISIFVLFSLVIYISVNMNGWIKSAKRLRKRSMQKVGKAKTPFQRLKAFAMKILMPFIRLLTPNYQVRMFFNMIFGRKPATIPRDRIRGGRCDNQRWIQINDKGEPQLDIDGTKGFCFSASMPKNIEWTLDAAKMPEFMELPANHRKEIEKRLKVVIPYDTDNSIKDGNTFFMPRCDQAYYKDIKDASGRPIRAPLFEDLGASCKLASHSLPRGSYGVKGGTKVGLLQKMERA